ncbi:MAG: CRISPR-associated primase-polymerase type B [Bacteroidales bacterium]|nr:CRISPR-associated primase-polymerase type B [Bacteroidales bacterium]
MNSASLYYGKEITRSSSDILVPVSLIELHQMICNPDASYMQLFERLQEVKKIDKNVFNRMKTRLPYFIGARFRDNQRKVENYIGIDYFIIDIDHYTNADMPIEELKKLLAEDKRIAFIFRSPGGEGLKAVFKLFENDLSPSEYSNFYKSFASEFSRYYHLEKYLDFTTHDPSRVCFLSYDPNALLNENMVEINPFDYLSQYDLLKISEPEVPVEAAESKDLNDDIYREILKTLNPKTPVRRRDVVVPVALENIPEPFQKKLDTLGIRIDEIIDIQYGKKIRIGHKEDKAEINIFYGKKGFSVVNCPVRGFSPQLAEIVVRIAENTIYEITEKRHISSPDFRMGNAGSLGKGLHLN